MLEQLKKCNPEIGVFSVEDPEFKTYGRVLALDTKEIVTVAETLAMPEEVVYIPSLKKFEDLAIAGVIQNEGFGTLPTQVGICYGHNTLMNATEWHTASEINIALTDMVLILGHVWDVVDDQIDSSRFQAFYVPKGAAVEVFATSLHYAPCQTSADGFKSVVALPKGTNTDLEVPVSDQKMTAKNKWLIAHVDKKDMIAEGAVAGLTGINFEIKY